MDNLRSRVNRWLPVLLWMGLIFFLSSQPHLPGYPHPLIDFLLKKMAHLFEYAVLAILLHRGVGDDDGWRALLIGGLYALSDEFHQGFVPGRNAELLDLAFDILGIVLGLYMAKMVISPKGRSC
ncbi:MAG: VanZ family protein [Anaerolineae bacterium]